MKAYETKKIRNVALVGHQSSGKTSLAEAMLYNSGAINRLGKVEEGNTASDWTDEEKERHHSLSTSLIPVEFNDYKINLLDTPGFADFQAETKNAIRVADSVCVVVDAVSGVEVGTELAWEYAKVYQQPIIVTINKLDRDNADFRGTLEQLATAFPNYKFIPVMLPIGEQANFEGVVNLMTRKAYYNEGRERADVPADMIEMVEAGHIELVEAAAEASETLIEKYFEDGDLSNDEIRDGMRMAARDHELRTVPVFVSSGTENIGTYPLLEAFTVYVSPPTQRRVGVFQPGEDEIEYINKPQSDDKPLAAYVFKSINDRYVGSLTFLRVFAGSVKSDSKYLNSTRNVEERFGQLMVMRGKEYENVDVLHTGDIGVVSKLSETYTGDTLTEGDGYTIVKPDVPEPLYMVAVEPVSQADNSKMGEVLSDLCNADPTLQWRHDPNTKQVILEGMGEIHVNLAIALAARLGCNLNTTVPKVPYKETITASASQVYRHKKQSGGAGQFAEVHLRVEPYAEESYAFESEIRGGAISSVFLPSIDKGVQSVLNEGVLAGYPIENVKVVVFDGKEHPVDSKDIAFQIAGREGFKQAFAAATPVLLEPVYDVEVVVPSEMMGDIMSDMNSRRGRVQGMDTIGVKSVVNAQVPLAEMLRYGNDLRSMTGGRGIYTMSLSHYERVPQHVAQEVIATNQKEPVN